MKKLFGILGLMALAAVAGLDPEMVSVNYTRDTGDEYANTNVYLSGTTLLFTNCIAFTTGSSTQNLTGVSVVLRVGNEKTNFTYSATTASAALGTFYGLVSLPSHRDMGVPVEIETVLRVQCTLTNAAGTSFTYRGSKLLTVRSGLTY